MASRFPLLASLLLLLASVSAVSVVPAECKGVVRPRSRGLDQTAPAMLLMKETPDGPPTDADALAALGLKKRKSVGSAGWMSVLIVDGTAVADKLRELQAKGYTVEADGIVTAQQGI